MLCSKQGAQGAQERQGQMCILVAEKATVICLNHALFQSMWGSCSVFSTFLIFVCATYGIHLTLGIKKNLKKY